MPSDSTAGQAPAPPGLRRTLLPGIGLAYTTARAIPTADASIIDLGQYATVVAEPTTYSIQIGVGKHIDGPGTLYLNHSCEPNVFVDSQTLCVVSLRPLAANTPLFFFYPANEWSMTAPFRCHCGASSCIGMVSGAAGTSREVLRRYRLNQHIRDLLTTAPDER